MTIGAVAREFGILSTADVKNIPPDVQDVLVVVLHERAVPFTGNVTFGDIPGGHAMHRGLRCACGATKYKLFYNGTQLGCARCTRHRSRRHNERRCRSWSKEGGELEDQVLRALRPGRRSSVVLPAVEALAQNLIDDDQQRWALLRRRADAALIAACAPPIRITDLLEESS